MYMSYCRYEGTFAELRACLNDAEEHVNHEAEYRVSNEEIVQFQRMVIHFTDWLHNMGLLDNDGELDEDVLGDICEAMEHSYCDD